MLGSRLERTDLVALYPYVYTLSQILTHPVSHRINKYRYIGFVVLVKELCDRCTIFPNIVIYFFETRIYLFLNCFCHFFSIQRHKHPFTFYWDVSHRWRRRSWGCFARSHLYGQCKLRPWDVLYSGTLLSVEKLSLYRKLNGEKPKDWRRYVRPRVTKKSPHFAYFLFSMLSSQSGAGLRNETIRNKTKKSTIRESGGHSPSAPTIVCDLVAII